LIFHQPKGCFLSDRQKNPECYAVKNFFIFFLKKKRGTAVFKKKKKKGDTASQHRRPQKVEKVDFDFLPIFRFLCQAPRCGSKFRKTHRSEVNINRVMTQNRIALFKPRPL
jgi:hypothetical protein